MQLFFSRSPFDEQPLLDTYQELLSRQIGAGNGMLSVDDTSFVKKGKHSVGVKRQYCGRLGKTENCQSGVFLAYAGDNGYGLVDYELYIPQEWFGDAFTQLRQECHIPEEVIFSTKNNIARRMINQVIRGGQFQVRWVGCDATYGNDHDFLDHLELPGGRMVFCGNKRKGAGISGISRNDFPRNEKGTPPEASVTFSWPNIRAGYRRRSIAPMGNGCVG